MIIDGLIISFVVPPPTVACDTKVDLCLIIDSSGSIRDNNPTDGSDNWSTQLEFLSNLIGDFTVGAEETRVGAVVFSEQSVLEFPLNRFYTVGEVQDAIKSIPYMGQTTNTPEALIKTRNECFSPLNGDRSDVTNLVIIVTDGLPFPLERRTPALDAAFALREAGVTMVAVGISDAADEDFLRAMSSPPQIEGQNFFTAIDFAELAAIRNTVVENTCRAVVTGRLCIILDFIQQQVYFGNEVYTWWLRSISHGPY